MGRPPLKDKDKRSKLVTLRLKESDHKQLAKDANAKGLSLSSYLVECWQKVRRK
ncbi:MAG: plasmid mobilization protein [Planctomycetota bacterium]